MPVKMARYLKGAIHIHTVFSDGHSTVPEVIATAQRAGLDFIVITDHDKLDPPQLAFQRRHGDLLVIYGYEMTVRPWSKNHILVLGVPSHRPYRDLPYLEKLRRIIADGGRTFIAHPWNLIKPWLLQMHLGWGRFPAVPFDGIEIWSFMHDWVGSLKLHKLLRQYRNPCEFLAGPRPEVLARWDRMNMRRAVAGIGSLDNHARRVPLSRKILFDNDLAFRTVRTHVMVDDDCGNNDAKDIDAILDALADGKSYIANDMLADSDGFVFCARRGGDVLYPGETAGFDGDCEIEIISPRSAHFKIIRNGVTDYESRSDGFRYRPKNAGIFRVEGRLGGRPWLFTNHIRLAGGQCPLPSEE